MNMWLREKQNLDKPPSDITICSTSTRNNLIARQVKMHHQQLHHHQLVKMHHQHYLHRQNRQLLMLLVVMQLVVVAVMGVMAWLEEAAGGNLVRTLDSSGKK